MSLRIVFAGTPEFALPCLQALLAGPVSPVAVFTQPDRPAGRGRQSQPSPIKLCAQQAAVPVYQPLSLRDPQAREQLAALSPDLMVVVAYGLLLPQKVLDIPRLGCWNVHASLLPRWRGAAPIQRAIEAGDSETGVCLMQMEKGLDTGPVLLRLRTPIAPGETAGQLHDRLAALGAEVLGDGLGLVRAGLLPQPQPQSEQGMCYARKLEKAEARLDWARPALELERCIRAFSPWPVAEVELAGERLRLHAAEVTQGAAAPGTVLRASGGVLEVACAEGALRLLRVQRENGRVISAADYLNARRDLGRKE